MNNALMPKIVECSTLMTTGAAWEETQRKYPWEGVDFQLTSNDPVYRAQINSHIQICPFIASLVQQQQTHPPLQHR